MIRLRALGTFLAKQWGSFFFTPVDLRLCAFLRIAYALLLLTNNVVWGGFLEMWFGEAGVLPATVARGLTRDYVLSVFDLAPTLPHWHTILFSLLTLHALLLLLGCWSRLQSLAVFVYVASFQHRNSVILDGEDILFRLFPFFLMFLPIGELWSLDAWWLRRKGARPTRLYPMWPLRFIQIEWSVIFLSSAGYKLLGETWRDGTALYYISRLEDFFGRFWLPAAPFESLTALKLLTWSVVVVELVVPITVWWPRTRRASLVVAICLHLGIDYMMNLFLFQWLMILGWLTFLTPEDLDQLAAWRRALWGSRRPTALKSGGRNGSEAPNPALPTAEPGAALTADANEHAC